MIVNRFSFKNLRLPLVLAGLMLLLIVGSALSAQVDLLNDGFERPTTFELWDGNGATAWTTSPSVFHSGLRSARASNNSEGLLTSDSLDASSAVPTVVDFWFWKTATTDTGFTLYYYNGSTYNLIAELDSLGADNVWLHYTQTITDPQYFVSDFRVRFDATLDGGQFAYVDDVRIYKEYGETLTVSKTGSGSGTVSSNPAGISCGLDCSESFATNTLVTLSAVSDTGSTFTGWSGDCTGTGDCVVTMDAAKSVTSTFTQSAFTLTVSKAGNGSGTLTSTPAGIDCGSDCSEVYDLGTEVTLSAASATGSTFTGWSGACTGTGDCVVTMDAARSVTATFTLNTFSLTVSKAGNGSGTVTSTPPGIDCGSDCSEDYDYNTEVTLSAEATTGSTFTGWSGACTGTGDCVVTMDAAKSVTATFTLNTYTLSVSKTGTGTGTVTSTPAGIDCGPDCSEDYNFNTQVTLSADADTGSIFTGWSGTCTSTGDCVVTMDGAKSVTAEFELATYFLYLPVIAK
jgi:hypothetical protein